MIQKVLVIRFRRVGDSVLATALCRSLKESFPGVEVHFVLNAGIAPLYEGHPDIDKVIAFTDEEQHGMAYLRKVWQKVRATRYDAIIDMRSTPKTLPFALFSPGTPYRIGRRKPYNAGVHNYRLENPSGVDRVQTNLNLMTPLAREGQLVMNPHFRLVITEEERRSFRSYMAREGVDFGRPVVLCAVTARLAERINADYRTGEQPPVIVGVLTGAFMFCSELIRRITVPCELAFIRLSSYSGTASTGLVREVMGLQEDIAGRDVIVVEDIVETGYSMRYLLDLLEARQPASIRTAVLLAKPSALCKQVPLDYVGMELPEGFLVGFGLDYDGLGRNLPDIYRERV